MNGEATTMDEDAVGARGNNHFVSVKLQSCLLKKKLSFEGSLMKVVSNSKRERDLGWSNTPIAKTLKWKLNHGYGFELKF